MRIRLGNFLEIEVRRWPRQMRKTGNELFYTRDYLKQWASLRNRVSVGDYTYGSPQIRYWSEDTKLIIGKFCSIADRVNIFLGGNHRTDWITTYPVMILPGVSNEEASQITGTPATKGDVVIGNDVWIGFGATIMSGVRIGDGAVIGARAVVTRDVSPYSIVAGNPAKPIGMRFDDEQIRELLHIRWWDWPIEKIRSNVQILCSSNIEMLRSLG